MGDIPNLPVTVATDWWAITFSAVATILGVIVGIKLSTRSFYTQKWWEKRAGAYIQCYAKLAKLKSLYTMLDETKKEISDNHPSLFVPGQYEDVGEDGHVYDCAPETNDSINEQVLASMESKYWNAQRKVEKIDIEINKLHTYIVNLFEEHKLLLGCSDKTFSKMYNLKRMLNEYNVYEDPKYNSPSEVLNVVLESFKEESEKVLKINSSVFKKIMIKFKTFLCT